MSGMLQSTSLRLHLTELHIEACTVWIATPAMNCTKFTQQGHWSNKQRMNSTPAIAKHLGSQDIRTSCYTRCWTCESQQAVSGLCRAVRQLALLAALGAQSMPGPGQQAWTPFWLP